MPNDVESPTGLPFVQLFTDGACRGNPGPGGWAYLLRHPKSGQERTDSGGLQETTNNQMELQGVIEGLKALKSRSRVEVITDSSYVSKGLQPMAGRMEAGTAGNGGKANASNRSRISNYGKSSTDCSLLMRCSSRGSRATLAIRKTNCATNWLSLLRCHSWTESQRTLPVSPSHECCP